jgi:hypothetical protein
MTRTPVAPGRGPTLLSARPKLLLETVTRGPKQMLVGALSEFEAFAAQTAFALGGPFGGVARGLGHRRASTN